MVKVELKMKPSDVYNNLEFFSYKKYFYIVIARHYGKMGCGVFKRGYKIRKTCLYWSLWHQIILPFRYGEGERSRIFSFLILLHFKQFQLYYLGLDPRSPNLCLDLKQLWKWGNRQCTNMTDTQKDMGEEFTIGQSVSVCLFVPLFDPLPIKIFHI